MFFVFLPYDHEWVFMFRGKEARRIAESRQGLTVGHVGFKATWTQSNYFLLLAPVGSEGGVSHPMGTSRAQGPHVIVGD